MLFSKALANAELLRLHYKLKVPDLNLLGKHVTKYHINREWVLVYEQCRALKQLPKQVKLKGNQAAC